MMHPTTGNPQNSYSALGGCDQKALKNYAAMSAMYWPGFDSAAGYAAAYTQAQASALAAANFGNVNAIPQQTQMDANSSSSMGTPSIGSSSPQNIHETSPQSTGSCNNAYIQETQQPQQNPLQLKRTANLISQDESLLHNNMQIHSSLISALGNSCATGGAIIHSNSPPTPPKKKAQAVPIHMKDETYWDRRKRNNESARRSRECRRMKEESIAYKAVVLEQENIQLRTQLEILRSELDKLRLVLYSTTNHHQGH